MDILCLQLCFILSFFLFHGLRNPYAIEDYQYQAVIFTVSQLLVILFGNNYEGIIRRGRFDELVAVVKYILEIDVIILFIFVAPAIYIKDPGPIFFTQERVGQNGKPFKMHKFRSMYMDAEERREQLARQNKTGDGKLFKVDDDPRIIGSEKKDKNGRPRGIGNFIRRTSIDEFPQFFDVLIGNMSLVGWQSCTLAEWENYDLKHRIRASMKPGMTGMWQVSGRSDITDFDEIVRMDREYIEEWSLLLDVKIILKTIKVVVTGKGAE